MATIQDENTQRERLSRLLSELGQIDAEDLVRDQDLGPKLDFRGGLPFFQRTLRLFRDIGDTSLDTVPYQKLSQLIAPTEKALGLFRKVREFTLDLYPNNPVAQRDALINQVRDTYDEFFEQLHPIIAYSVRKGTDFRALEKQAQDTLAVLEQRTREQVKRQEQISAGMQSVLDQVKTAAAQVGVSQHTVHFKTEAEQHDAQAEIWLGRTQRLAAATFIAGVGFFALHL